MASRPNFAKIPGRRTRFARGYPPSAPRKIYKFYLLLIVIDLIIAKLGRDAHFCR